MKRLLSISMATLWATSANASPTSNEFAACDKIAVATLESCLQVSDNQCWKKSQAHYQSCRQKVAQKYSPNKARIQAEKQQREKHSTTLMEETGE